MEVGAFGLFVQWEAAFAFPLAAAFGWVRRALCFALAGIGWCVELVTQTASAITRANLTTAIRF
eukprot:1352589-Prorocentrum_lima.AAC.1